MALGASHSPLTMRPLARGRRARHTLNVGAMKAEFKRPRIMGSRTLLWFSKNMRSEPISQLGGKTTAFIVATS